MQFLFDFKNYVRKIVSKSPNLYLVRLQGKITIPEKEKNTYIYMRIYYIFVYYSVPVISRFPWLI